MRLQSLALLVALLLGRQRQPPTGLAGSGHVEVGVALMSLPSGLLAIIGQAMTKLESKLEVCHSPGLHTQKSKPARSARCAVYTPFAVRCDSARTRNTAGLLHCWLLSAPVGIVLCGAQLQRSTFPPLSSS